MNYEVGLLRELSDGSVAALRAHPSFFDEVPGDTFLPAMIQFQLNYLAAGDTPPAPRPVLMLTLYPVAGQATMNLGLIEGIPEYTPAHDDPVVSPVLLRSFLSALLLDTNVLTQVLPVNGEELRPVPREQWPGAAAAVGITPQHNVVEQNADPNAEIERTREVLSIL